MTTALRPMSTGELLDRAFNLYRNNFPLFAGISALAAIILVVATVLLVVLGISIPTPGARIDPRTALGGLMIYFIVIGLFYLVGASLATGATIYAVSKAHLGQAVTIGESYSIVFPWLGRIIRIVLSIIVRMIGVLLVVYVIAVVLAVGVGALIGARGVQGTGTAGVIVITAIVVGLCIVLGYGFVIRVYFKYSLAVPACLLEKAEAVQAMRRSAVLTKGSLWRIFLIYLLMGLIGAVFSIVLQLPANFLVSTSTFLALIWQSVATFIAFSLSFPISNIAISLVYYDQRVRKEAFDLQLMMEALGQGAQGQSAPAPIG